MAPNTETLLERTNKQQRGTPDRLESWVQAEKFDWRRNFATKSSDISRNLLTEDSGYIGLDSSFSSSTSSTPSPKEPRQKQGWWEKQQRSSGEKSSFLLEEPRVRWRVVEPHQLLGLLASCILLACIGFSLLTVHRHSHENNSFTAFSNGKYRSIQHGSSASTTSKYDETEKSITKAFLGDRPITMDDSQVLQEFYENIDTSGKGDNVVEVEQEDTEQKELTKAKAKTVNSHVGITNSAINFSIDESDPDASEKDANDQMIRMIQAGLKKKLEVLQRVQLEAELKVKKEKLLAKLKSNGILSAPLGKTVNKDEVGSKPSTTEVSQTDRVAQDQSEDLRSVSIASKEVEAEVSLNTTNFPESNKVRNVNVKPKQRSKHSNPLLMKATSMSKVRTVKREL